MCDGDGNGRGCEVGMRLERGNDGGRKVGMWRACIFEGSVIVVEYWGGTQLSG